MKAVENVRDIGTAPRLLWSVGEAARALGVSRATAFARISDGTLPSIKLGRRRLVPIAALRELIAAHTENDRSMRGGL